MKEPRAERNIMALPVSPLAVALPELPPLAGVRLGAAAAGIRYQDRTDVVMAELAPGSTVAGVFTRNRCPGAPVDWCRAALGSGRARALVVNAGNANVFTGRAGRQACAATAQATAELVGCGARQVFVASTGVIGEVLPHERLIAVLPALHGGLREDAWADAARGIMTTDTFPKAATCTAMIGDAPVRITGIAKGSGMIAPDMATMLSFVFTDARIPADLLDTMLHRGVDASFNCTTVDSDTSTSDTVLLFATGQTKHPRVSAGSGSAVTGRLLRDFAANLNDLLLDLALQVVRDGEGAQKLVRVDVGGAVSSKSAHRIAMAVANSPLVKTAVAGEDANWGRIVMAVGKAGEPADRDRLSVAVGGVWMARDGGVVPGYDEAPVVAHMKGREVEIAIDLGLGRGKATAWTCDLTHGYIDINGSYRS
jgi:glutamate N-acetyltransferase/amino-acid N-acetyltransferase